MWHNVLNRGDRRRVGLRNLRTMQHSSRPWLTPLGAGLLIRWAAAGCSATSSFVNRIQNEVLTSQILQIHGHSLTQLQLRATKAIQHEGTANNSQEKRTAALIQ
jgi:hypothetical protein